jgi:hypothetical protein
VVEAAGQPAGLPHRGPSAVFAGGAEATSMTVDFFQIEVGDLGTWRRAG